MTTRIRPVLRFAGAARPRLLLAAAPAVPRCCCAPSLPAVPVSGPVAVPRRAYASASAADADDPPPPPLLAKLKGDLKAAMRAKDKPRLSVLRAILAATLNASKTAQPIRTDAQLVALLRKTARSAQEAAAEFRAADRSDLAEAEEAQIRVLEEYAQGSGIASVDAAALQAAAEAVLAELAAAGASAGGKNKTSEVIKRLLAPGGPLDGKDFDKGEMARIVKTLTAEGS